MSKSSGHEGEAVEKQQSGVEDEAEERQRNQDEDMAQVMQPRGPGRGEAEEEPEEMQCKIRRRHGVPRTGSSGAQQEGAAETKRQQKAEEADLTPRTEPSRAEPAAGAAAPRTGASGDKWRPDALDGCIWDGTRSRGCRPTDWIFRGQTAAERQGLDHPARFKQREPPHPGLDHPGKRGGLTPRTGTSGVDQAAGTNAPTTRKSMDTWRVDAPDWNMRGRAGRSGHNPRGRGKMVCRPGQDCPRRINQKGSQPPAWSVQEKAAARGEGNRRPRPRWCSEGNKPGSNAKGNAEEMQRGREADEAEETQGSKDEDGAVVKQRNRPMDKAGVMQRSSCEEKAVVQQRGGGEDEAAKR